MIWWHLYTGLYLLNNKRFGLEREDTLDDKLKRKQFEETLLIQKFSNIVICLIDEKL